MTNKRRPRGTLQLVQPLVEAAPKPTKKVTQAATKSSSKGPQSLSLAWDENEGMGQARDQRPLSEYERKDTLYRVYEGNTWVSACVDVLYLFEMPSARREPLANHIYAGTNPG